MDDAGHARVALQGCDVGRVDGDDTEARLQARDRGELHVLLAERREHLFDVAQEHRARPDEEDALVREPAPVRVEQVRGAVERDRRLAGAGPTRDHEHAVHVGADRFVLFGLDGRDDVAHAAGAVLLERGEERSFARDPQPLVLDRELVEHLVVEAGHLAALAGDEVAAADDRHRLDRGGPVEGLGDRCAPVDDERRVVLVLDREAPHVPPDAAFEIEPAEDQGRLTDVEIGQPALGHVPGDVPFEPGLMGAARAHVGVGGTYPLGGGAHGFEAGVRPRDIALLCGELGVDTVGQIAPLHGRNEISGWVSLVAPACRAGLRPRLGAMPAALYFTPDADANRLLAAEPLAVMIGMLLDQQVPMEWAFTAPALLKERLGGGPLDAVAIAAMEPAALEAIFRDKPALHRYPGSMAKRAHALCTFLVEHYAGRADAVWNDAPTGDELYARVVALPGFGQAKARIFVGLLGKRLGVRPPGWEVVAADWPSIADVDTFERVGEIREQKRAMKAAAKKS